MNTWQHDTYDHYWKSRNIRPHLKNIRVPVMVVGGWFDAEDLFGALHTYEAIEKQSPVNKNYACDGAMDTWSMGKKYLETNLEPMNLASNINKYFQDSIETKFFNYYLKDKGGFNAS